MTDIEALIFFIILPLIGALVLGSYQNQFQKRNNLSEKYNWIKSLIYYPVVLNSIILPVSIIGIASVYYYSISKSHLTLAYSTDIIKLSFIVCWLFCFPLSNYLLIRSFLKNKTSAN